MAEISLENVLQENFISAPYTVELSDSIFLFQHQHKKQSY